MTMRDFVMGNIGDSAGGSLLCVYCRERIDDVAVMVVIDEVEFHAHVECDEENNGAAVR